MAVVLFTFNNSNAKTNAMNQQVCQIE